MSLSSLSLTSHRIIELPTGKDSTPLPAQAPVQGRPRPNPSGLSPNWLSPINRQEFRFSQHTSQLGWNGQFGLCKCNFRLDDCFPSCLWWGRGPKSLLPARTKTNPCVATSSYLNPHAS